MPLLSYHDGDGNMKTEITRAHGVASMNLSSPQCPRMSPKGLADAID